LHLHLVVLLGMGMEGLVGGRGLTIGDTQSRTHWQGHTHVPLLLLLLVLVLVGRGGAHADLWLSLRVLRLLHVDISMNGGGYALHDCLGRNLSWRGTRRGRYLRLSLIILHVKDMQLVSKGDILRWLPLGLLLDGLLVIHRVMVGGLWLGRLLLLHVVA
jgi:hypothetical protein